MVYWGTYEMLDQINVFKIVSDHFKTFKNYRTKQYSPIDFVIFLGVPFIIAGVLLVLFGSLPQNLIGVVVTSLSVFTALLLNLLMAAYTVARNASPLCNEGKIQVRKDLIHEMFSNISFAILVAIVTAVFVLCFGMIYNKTSPHIIYALNFFIYFFGLLFLLTLLMLLRRVYSLLQSEQIIK